MKTVAIIYGWAEGPWQGGKFKKQLEQSGFRLSSDPRSADVIIGHSAGCYFLPEAVGARLIILIGLPFWPRKLLIISLLQKLWWEIHHHRRNSDLTWWLHKTIHNIWYTLTKPSLTPKALIAHRRRNLPSVSEGRKIILIRNDADTFCHPDIQNSLEAARKYHPVELAGGHDDCWMNPKPYIDLLLKEL